MVKAISIKQTSALIIAGVVMATFAILTPLSANAERASAGAKPGTQTIAQIAVGNPDFDTLVAALSCEGLVPLVSGTKQLTVFAPTDAAFAKLNLTPENVCSTPGLANILGFHVTEGRRTSTSVLAAPSYKMLNGDRLSRTQLATAGIATTNISASNGIIHVINSVLLP
jgi:uncharacterized surface protein with fasciclin (FAS1) repeats